MANEECRSRFKNQSQVITVHDFATICAYSGKIGHGACSGDSGGPLVAENKLIGVGSWAAGCAKGYPEGYARISSYIRWVNRKIKS